RRSNSPYRLHWKNLCSCRSSNRCSQPHLLALGTTGVELDADEIELARRLAKTVNGVMTVEKTKKAAAAPEAAGQTDRARRLRSWLTEVTAGKEKLKGRAAGSYPGG
ncbi:MAG TPA: hypothetical protein VHS97_05965, partial [Isosphaeraceae bacterium]|nr:hypothetical protein [Isosphaeraceae bacterium]